VIKTNYITVNPSPTASFTANSQLGCSPSTFQFTDGSSDAAGSIVKWAWTFSDGTTSTAKNPVKQFTTVGFYDVSLTVTSSTGCTAGTGGNRYIRIVPGVKADFTDTFPGICRPPFPVKFSSQTSGPGTLTYNWDFGNSTSSTLPATTATYVSPGTYTVKLTAQSDYGCQGSIQKTITLAANNASFTSPDSVCQNGPASFQNTSTPIPPNTIWDFGDGTQSNQTSPSKTYSSPGVYPVTMIGNYPTCSDTAKKNIVVRTPPVVNFTSPKKVSCKPFTVSFQDSSPDAVAWSWNFGDGGTSSQQNPTHPYASLGQYDVTLTITDSKGCQNTIKKTNFVEIIAPVAGISTVPAGGCAPYLYKAVSNSAQVDGIVDYSWDFGDGGGYVSSGATPSATYTYNNPGNYTLSLKITTTDGCTSTITTPNAVKVGTHSVVDFDKDLLNVCHSSTVTFNNLSVPRGDEAVWVFGDGSSATDTIKASHKYADTGTYTVTLININNGCPDTATKQDFIKVLPPVAHFRYKVDCSSPDRNVVNFNDSSITDPVYGPISYRWDFGDGNTATGIAAMETYPTTHPKKYDVQLIVDNGACSDTITRPVLILNESADFIPSTITPCRNQVIVCTPVTSTNIILYQWVIDGKPPITSPNSDGRISTSFATIGSHTIQLIITDFNGCSNSLPAKTITVIGPKAIFSISNNGGCLKSTVQFTDQSTPSPTGIINQWAWDFGDNSTPATTQNATHSFADTGVYSVTLTVKDDQGCFDETTLPATITKPSVYFGTDTTLFCPGGPMTFRDSSKGKGINTWTWYFGDGTTGTGKNAVHAYSGGDAVYSVKLIVTDVYGCSDSLTRTNYVTIKKAKPAFGVKDSSTICPPLETSFFFQGKDYEAFFWDFGDGGSSSLANPTHFFNSYGSDTVKLYLVGFGGCLDSASSVVNIYNPYTTTDISYPPPYTQCNELNVDFTFVTPPSTRSYFYFGDGSLDSTQVTTLHHYYGSPAFYAPYVSVVDGQGCIANIGGHNTIRVLGAVPIFGLDRKKFCDAGDVAFTNFTVNNDPVVSEVWDFGDNSSTTITTPADVVHTNTNHTYTQPGLYVTSLTATTQAGCIKTLFDTVRVLRTPDPSIKSSDPICVNNSIQFEGLLAVPDTAISWNWDFGNGQTSKQEQATIVYTKPGTFLVRASAANSLGCMDTTSKIVLVNPLPVITVTGDTTMLVGTGITIPVFYSPNAVSYNWTPASHLSCTDCATPYADPKFTTTYQVTVTDENNCSATREITLITLCNNKNFFIPNTFSPNRDGANDVFYPRGTGIDRIQALRIFNRWGELLFEKRFFPANDPGSGWDGTYKGKPASTDTYIYMIDIICENATLITYKGNVTLIR